MPPVSPVKKLFNSLIDNLWVVLGFLFAFSCFWYGIGFYFGYQHDIYQHNTEINNLNFAHLKELNVQIDKTREAEDKLKEYKVEELRNTVNLLQKKLDEKKD